METMTEFFGLANLVESELAYPALHLVAPPNAGAAANFVVVHNFGAANLAVQDPQAYFMQLEEEDHEEKSWTDVVSRRTRKANFKTTKHETQLEVNTTGLHSPGIQSVLIETDEVLWIPKTSSRRATMKWSMARRGSLMGSGFFIYGSYGQNEIEY